MVEQDNEVQETVDTTAVQEDRVEEQEVAQAQPSDAERNFAELREQKKRLERERDEFKRRMEEVEASQRKQAEPKQTQPSLADDDLVEWKYVKQEIDGLKNQINSYQQQSSSANAEARLKSKYTDFDKVVNQSNIEQLREQYPEIAQTLSSNQDLYSQASAAYDIIKRYGIYNDKTFDTDKQRVQENAAKPRPISSSSGQRGESPLDQANAFADGLTPDLKAKLFKEMQDAIKRR